MNTVTGKKEKWEMKVEILRNNGQKTAIAYRQVITGIYMDRMKNGHKVYAVCGCSKGAGATSVSVELAAELAEAGWRTLLIDTDFYRKKERQKVNTGLTEYVLNNNVDIVKIAKETAINNLDYIGTGNSDKDNAISILCSERMESLIRDVYSRYDFIIFDTISLAASSEGEIICSKADAVILVAAIRETGKQQLNSAKEKIEELEKPITGIVITKANSDVYTQYMRQLNPQDNKRRILLKGKRKRTKR